MKARQLRRKVSTAAGAEPLTRLRPSEEEGLALQAALQLLDDEDSLAGLELLTRIAALEAKVVLRERLEEARLRQAINQRAAPGS
jgi:hypothetical protein